MQFLFGMKDLRHLDERSFSMTCLITFVSPQACGVELLRPRERLQKRVLELLSGPCSKPYSKISL